MKKCHKFASLICILAFSMTISLGTGCATKAQTGAAVGAGTGALIGGLANMHGSWGATALVGAGVGAGVGYLIGNEQDKQDAQRREAVRVDETRPLAGTTWKVIKVTPAPERKFKSVVTSFHSDGTLVTTKTTMNGVVHKETERYRVVGSTLIISKADYVVNATFTIKGKKLTIDYGNGNAVFERIS